ncbi:hypothetical protein [Klebsiella pneumoniae]
MKNNRYTIAALALCVLSFGAIGQYYRATSLIFCFFIRGPLAFSAFRHHLCCCGFNHVPMMCKLLPGVISRRLQGGAIVPVVLLFSQSEAGTAP